MKIAILTNMMSFMPGYSLTGIVKDQATMLARHGHDVHLFVNENYNGESFPADVTLEKKIPFAHLEDFHSACELSTTYAKQVREGLVGEEPQFDGSAIKKKINPDPARATKIAELINCKNKTAVMLADELSNGYEMAFTHDFVFIGWFMPYGMACAEAGQHLDNVRWLHWIHSVPTAMSDWWDIRRYGPRHKLVYPNKTDALRCAEQFRGTLNDVRVIPHIKDLRTWFDFSEETKKFIDRYPAVMQADIVQIYPASVDRLSAKRVREVILLFSHFKKMGYSVCLVVANQWATTKQHKENVDNYKKIATRNGLVVGAEVVFTSDLEQKYEVGIPKTMVRELFQCSNLFIFPTREETFGLVMPEAALSGGVFMVLNKSLEMMAEISGHSCLSFDFGSFHMNVEHPNEKEWLELVAKTIVGRMMENESVMAKTHIRQNYNFDHLYDKHYGPIMAESKVWL